MKNSNLKLQLQYLFDTPEDRAEAKIRDSEWAWELADKADIPPLSNGEYAGMIKITAGATMFIRWSEMQVEFTLADCFNYQHYARLMSDLIEPYIRTVCLGICPVCSGSGQQPASLWSVGPKCIICDGTGSLNGIDWRTNRERHNAAVAQATNNQKRD